MKPELVISKAKARKGVLSAEEVLQLARFAGSMRDFARVMLEAYLASEEYALRGGSREDCAAALERADGLIEEFGEAVYGEGWRRMGSEDVA